jgi:hypothetical protein
MRVAASTDSRPRCRPCELAAPTAAATATMSAATPSVDSDVTAAAA